MTKKWNLNPGRIVPESSLLRSRELSLLHTSIRTEGLMVQGWGPSRPFPGHQSNPRLDLGSGIPRFWARSRRHP